MLICGAEEPLGPNPQLYALDEASGDVVLSEFEIAEANRYSFVWIGPSRDAPHALSALLTDVAERLALTATWCAIWRIPYDTSAAGRVRTIRWKYEKQGWEVRVAAGFGLAAKSVSPKDITWPPKLEGTPALVVGRGVDADVLYPSGIASPQPVLAAAPRGEAGAHACAKSLERVAAQAG